MRDGAEGVLRCVTIRGIGLRAEQGCGSFVHGALCALPVRVALCAHCRCVREFFGVCSRAGAGYGVLRALGGWRRVFARSFCGVSTQLLRSASLFGAATAVFSGVLGAGAGNGSYARDGDGGCAGPGGCAGTVMCGDGGGDGALRGRGRWWGRGCAGGLLRQGRGWGRRHRVTSRTGTGAFCDGASRDGGLLRGGDGGLLRRGRGRGWRRGTQTARTRSSPI